MPGSEQPWILNETISTASKSSVTPKTKTSRTGVMRKPAVNQTLSCAECRRLKLRCDRVFPCGSCQKRGTIAAFIEPLRIHVSPTGIAELCPEGSLPTRNKPPTSLTDKEQLYQKLSELRGRILELENALEIAHSQVSTEAHPLLSNASSKRKAINKRRKQSQGAQPDDEIPADSEESDSLDEALGSLHMDSDGRRSKFLGRSACVEYRKESIPAKASEANILVSAEVAMIYQSFPFLTLGEATNLLQERVWRHLPPLDRAQRLRQNYCRHMYHVTDIIPVDGWFEDLFSRVYLGTQNVDIPVSFSESGIRADELALIFAYFALAALVDLDLTPFNYEAEAYACLARSALTSMNIMQNATIVTIETLILLAYFEEMWGEVIGSGDAWMLTAFATKLAENRNSLKFGLESLDADRRSKVYWELHSLELSECLSHGRPATFVLIPADVAMPKCPNPQANLHNFRYRFAAECLTPLIRQAFGLKAPPYNLVVELDRKIRKLCSEFEVGVMNGQPVAFNSLDESAAMENYVKIVYRESVRISREFKALLYLHRTFFIRAVSSNPSDPQHTKYGLSVSGAYESAMFFVQTAGEIFEAHPVTMSRALLCWSHTLCSVFILGTMSIHCTGSRLAPLAAKRLHDANDLYRKASAYGGRAMADSPFVIRMTEHSHNAAQAYAEYSRHSKVSGTKHSPLHTAATKQDPDDDTDELALLGGRTRLIKTAKDSPTSPASQSVYSPSQRQLSPGITETSSQSDASAFSHDRSPQWRAEFKYTEDRARGFSGDHDYHVSSNGSVSSGMSPVPTPYSKQVDYQQTVPPKGPDPHIQDHDAFHRGVPGYGHVSTIMQGPNGSVPYNTGDIQVVVGNPQDPYYLGNHADDVPMDISADTRDWNFLDDWYGHIFSLDVIPPNYGETSKI
ncbi:hypothetical protein Clacol_002751 [Clathrus columnatus]|uniref:Zn(2)-C6 fungal-type domain-containing protein n=1 Tax=Clathrus columnatus TaxID=1419009 RepID=A0AAV5A7B5_9AGAM|nr:hypothetical protein Clacol_002751 [Clathrus columnatus]